MANIEAIIWYLFVIDAIGANLTALFWKKWWNKKKWAKYIPMSFLWTFLYLILVLWIGFTLYRLGILF